MVRPSPPPAGDLKFQVLADELRRDILASVWPPGSKLPTDAQLRSDTGLAQSTIRRAYDLLESQGYVVRRQGAGTFVADRVAAPGVNGRTVGVLIPVTQLYYGKVMQGIEAELSAARVGIRFAAHDYDEGIERAKIRDLIEAGVDGLILVPAGYEHELTDARTQAFAELPVPVVLVERMPIGDVPTNVVEYVCSDHAGGALDAVRHLRKLGHTCIALCARSDAPTRTGVQRGYRAALSAFGAEGIEILHSNADWPGAASQALADIRDAGCTAALVFGDREATLLLEASRRLGVDVPRELALVSYDDEFADIASVPLTAVSPARHRMGEMAGKIMVQRLQQGAAGVVHQVRLRPRLIVRQSCGVELGGR